MSEREDFKTSGSFTDLYSLTFRLRKYKQKTEDNKCSAEKGWSYIRSVEDLQFRVSTESFK